MKIAFVTPQYFDGRSYVGGGERYPVNLARGVRDALGDRSIVEIVSYGQYDYTTALFPGIVLRVLRANRGSGQQLVLSPQLWSAISDAALVHVHQVFTRSSEMAVIVAKHGGKPVCVTDHGGTSSTLGLNLGLLDLVDRVIAYSDFGARQLPTTENVEVIPGGVDGSWFTPTRRDVTRDRFLYVGRIMPHKGIDRLIKAVPSHLPLTVCGKPYNKQYFRLLVNLSAKKRVEFVTDADDIALRELYRRSWATVLPSVYRDCFGNTFRAPELMGFSLLESMACGTPAICSRVGAMPEFVLNGVTGYIFDSVDELTDLLTNLSRNPELVARLGRHAREAIDSRFDLSVAGARMTEVYRRVLETA